LGFHAFKVEALNKQGNLNDYLDISAGSGTHAPRQRQAYASKRLQQVITDFRKRQIGSSLSSASQSGSGATSQDDDNESDSNQTTDTTKAPATKKRKTVMIRDTTSAQTRRSTTASLAKLSSRRSKGKARTEEDSKMSDTDDEDGFVPPRDVMVEEPKVERNLRPRPKPRLLHRGQNETKTLP
jgi:DNA excision repair protein ERCC-5